MNYLLKNHWELIGMWPFEWKRIIDEKGIDISEITQYGVTPWIKATVPGSIHNDLYGAGIIEDPYYSDNSVKCEWVHQRAWVYKTNFKITDDMKNKKFTLLFEGVDYFSYYYLNGKYLGFHEGMFTPARWDIQDEDLKDNNEVLVIIEKAPDEVAQFGKTNDVTTQKSRFSYNWDFSTRLINMGIWKDVYLVCTDGNSIDDIYIEADSLGEVKIEYICSLEDKATIKYDIYLNNESFSICSKTITGEKKSISECKIPDPQMWWPNGYGNQNLYTLKARIIINNVVADEKKVVFGLRDIEFLKNPGSPDNSLPYTIKINGKELFIKGWNWVPADMMYGTLDYSRYEHFIKLVAKANVNLLRIWGGGLIETEDFYKLCNKYGIMVWQEFIQSSTSISNQTSIDPVYLKLLAENSIEALIQKRNHPCLVNWCGGNELIYDEGFIPQDYKDPNLSMLKGLVKKYDPKRMFLPTSPSGPKVHFHKEDKGKNIHHDIHGNWLYEGMNKHYNKYNSMDCLIHTEFGCPGCADIESVKKTIPEEKLFPAGKMNKEWNHHGGRWWDTSEIDNNVFGDINNLDDEINVSQLIQAEGLRYIIESHLRRKPNCSGTIPWQFNEPWPNCVCTSSVDYYGIPKMAYYFIKNAYNKKHVSMKYRSLVYLKGNVFDPEIFFDSDDKEKYTTCISIYDIKGKLQFRDKHEYIKPYKIEWNNKKVAKDIFIVVVEAWNVHREIVSSNTYFFSQKEKNPMENILINKTTLYSKGIDDNKIYIKNTGENIALFVYLSGSDIRSIIYANENYLTILPGEEKTINYEWIKGEGTVKIKSINVNNMTV